MAAITALIPLLVATKNHARDASESAKEAKDQVSNAHTKNFRDDFDDFRSKTFARFDVVFSQLSRLGSSDEELESRIRSLEDTVESSH